jgi:hypothetical protein
MSIPIIFESRCHTCCHPERAWIERMMIRGMSFVWIANTLNRIEGGNMRRRSLSRHYERHLAPVMARLEARLLRDAELEAMLNRARGENEACSRTEFLACSSGANVPTQARG